MDPKIMIDPVRILRAGIVPFSLSPVNVREHIDDNEKNVVEISFEAMIRGRVSRKSNLIVRSAAFDDIIEARRDGAIKMLQKHRDHYGIKLADFSFMYMAKKRMLFDAAYRHFGVASRCFSEAAGELGIVIGLLEQWKEYGKNETVKFSEHVRDAIEGLLVELEIIVGRAKSVSSRCNVIIEGNAAYQHGSNEINKLREYFDHPMVYDEQSSDSVIVEIFDAMAESCEMTDVMISCGEHGSEHRCLFSMVIDGEPVNVESGNAVCAGQAILYARFKALKYMTEELEYSVIDIYQPWLGAMNIYFAKFDDSVGAVVSGARSLCQQAIDMYTRLSSLKAKVTEYSSEVHSLSEEAAAFAVDLDHGTDHCYSIMKACTDIIVGKMTFAEIQQDTESIEQA